MYSIDPAMKRRIEPLLRRVLIVDANRHMAELLGECLKTFGAATVATEADPATARLSAETIEPTLIVTEALEDADPFALVRSIRRSPMTCRQAPIIVLTTLATASGAVLASDAGAQAFMRKPFCRRTLALRLDDLARQPRPWVEKSAYAGPDRRSFNNSAAKRRLSDRIELIGQGVPATQIYLVR